MLTSCDDDEGTSYCQGSLRPPSTVIIASEDEIYFYVRVQGGTRSIPVPSSSLNERRKQVMVRSALSREGRRTCFIPEEELVRLTD